MSEQEHFEVVDRALRDSMQAHEAARAARQGRGTGAVELLVRARDLRLEALAADPGRTSPAWAAEVARMGRDVHEALMAFYEQKVPR